ncbi:MAG: YdeI/OmpD-associated family protein [Sphingomonadales bacterium]
MSRDPRVDAYVDRQAEFARPILTHLRALVHRACPQTDEAIKWGMPAFLSDGKQFAHMAAFKAHASFGLWNGRLVIGGDGSRDEAMGQFGRLTSIDDLPDEATLAALVRKARELRNAGVSPPRRRSQPKPAAETPEDLAAALGDRPEAAANFAGFSPSAQREYVEWITEAKRPETRARRVAQAAEWIAEGKKRNWKYERG